MSAKRYKWAAAGDVNAFFGLMLDNIADLLLTVTLLHVAFEFPTTFALQNMVPGTAIGVLVGDLLFFWMAISLAKRTGRQDITAMPLGLDTPSTFGMVFFVLGPAFAGARANGMDEVSAARLTWHIGICSIFISGIFKVVCAFGSDWVRRVVPRAGLLGSLAAIALVLISFLPLLEVLQHPVTGFAALAIILGTLVARAKLPFKVPGALGALIVGGVIYYLMKMAGLLGHFSPPDLNPSEALMPTEWLTVFKFEWLQAMGETVKYLPIVIPFALATVIGGIDCTESAAASGDEFSTGGVIGVEAFATIVAAMCGGVIQTTPYIGHPAYKAMGGRAAYTLWTALFVAAAGVIGFFGYMYVVIPKPCVFPILIFVGLEITAQSFRATPKRHYTAVAIACIPALAFLAHNFANQIDGQMSVQISTIAAEADSISPELAERLRQIKLSPELDGNLKTIKLLSQGFILTSLIWAAALAAMIDKNFMRAAIYFLVCAGFTLFGLIHSPFDDGKVFLAWTLDKQMLESVLRYTCGYAVVGGLLIGWHYWLKSQPPDDKAPEVQEDSE